MERPGLSSECDVEASAAISEREVQLSVYHTYLNVVFCVAIVRVVTARTAEYGRGRADCTLGQGDHTQCSEGVRQLRSCGGRRQVH